MIQGLDPASEQFLNALSQLQSSLQRVQRHVSTGVRIERASDAPERVTDIVRRESDVARAEQIRRSMGNLQAETDVADASLQQAVRVLEQAIVTGERALNTASSSQGLTFAAELDGLHSHLVRLSLSTADGRYVFGGDSDDQPPYQPNPLQPNGVDQLTTPSATRLVLDVDGSRFLARRTAEEIFDHRNPDNSLAADNAFAAVQSLKAAVQSGDAALTAAAIIDVKAAHTYLNRQLAFYGNVQSRVRQAIEQSHQLETRLHSELSTIRDTDLAAAATELTRLQTSIQATLQARSNFAPPTLFDFLG